MKNVLNFIRKILPTCNIFNLTNFFIPIFFCDLIKKFNSLDCNVDVYDPWVNEDEAFDEYNINLISQPSNRKYDAIVLAVAHDAFKEFSSNEIAAFGKDNHVIYDIKYLLSADEVDGRL